MKKAKTIDLGAIRESIWERVSERLSSASDEARQQLIRDINALRGCLEAARELVPQIEHTKPDYLQVGECKTYDSNYGRSGEVKLPFTGMHGYYQNQIVELSQGASDTVRAVAQAISGRQGDKLEPGTYRYAILLYRVEEPAK